MTPTRLPAPAPAAADVSDVAARLGNAATRLARLLRQQDSGQLSPTTRATIGTIARRGPITLGDLAAHEQVAPPTITKVVARLEAAGLVERQRDPADRRVHRVVLSDAGRRQLETDRKRRRAWLATHISRLPAGDAEALADALDALERLTAAKVERR